jgi:hypothetical protein
VFTYRRHPETRRAFVCNSFIIHVKSERLPSRLRARRHGTRWARPTPDHLVSQTNFFYRIMSTCASDRRAAIARILGLRDAPAMLARSRLLSCGRVCRSWTMGSSLGVLLAGVPRLAMRASTTAPRTTALYAPCDPSVHTIQRLSFEQ